MRVRSVISLALAAALAVAAGCAPAGAQEPPQPNADTRDLWRCFAHSAYYAEREGGAWPKTKVISGRLVFHSATPDPEWQSVAAIHFMSVNADPEMSHGNGITAVVRTDKPDRIGVFMVVDGEHQMLGTYPYGTPVPFKITFNDELGTVRLESGEFARTEKPAKLLRPHFKMTCSGADVSFADVDMQS